MDNIIVLGDALKQRALQEKSKGKEELTEKELIAITASQSIEGVVETLDKHGYDVSDPDLLLDLETILRLLGAALSKQKGVENPNIKIINQLNDIDEDNE